MNWRWITDPVIHSPNTQPQLTRGDAPQRVLSTVPSVRRLAPTFREPTPSTPPPTDPPPRSLGSIGAEGDIGDLDVFVAAEARPAPPGRPWVLCNMVASVDGASSGPDGKSRSLSGPADRRLFHALRNVADVVLAGAGTIRAENYGAPRGEGPGPRLSVASASLALDPEAKFFQEPTLRPIVLTTDEAVRDGRADPLTSVAEVRAVGDRLVDWDRALTLLREEFATEILLVEGGALLNGQLLAADLVDELRLTVSPIMVGGSSRRIVSDAPNLGPLTLTLDDVLEEDGFLFLRYLRDRH